MESTLFERVHKTSYLIHTYITQKIIQFFFSFLNITLLKRIKNTDTNFTLQSCIYLSDKQNYRKTLFQKYKQHKHLNYYLSY